MEKVLESAAIVPRV